MKNNLKLVVMENCKGLGEKVNIHLQKTYDESMLISISNSRFSNGEGKIKIEDSIRDQDLYILSDVGNYDISYSMHGRSHFMSPDEHFQDIKRVISAASGYASKITVVMPLLYQSRQHKRKGRESLDCAIALQELERLGVDHIVTFDCHDPNVSNAVPLLPFESFYPTDVILSTLLEKEKLDQLFVVSPDFGAMERAKYYAEMLGCDVGAFYKRRDLTRIVDGKNPILEHTYLGDSVEGKDVLVVDDMIASGSSMIEVGEELKKRGANRVYFVATFALLTEGPSSFIDAYQRGVFDKLYSTNLSYVPDSIRFLEWYEEVDCSNQLADIIETLHEKRTMSPLINRGRKEILQKNVRRNEKMRIGIFGGSFNPPHRMHLDIGKKMISHGYVDKVIYVPTGKKYPKSNLLDDELRYQMTSLMVEDEKSLEVSDYELQNHLVYTYQTLDYFKKKFPDDEVYFILGSDLYSSFSTWKNYEYVLENYPILVVLRDDDSKEELEQFYSDISKNVIFTDVQPFVLSSTKVRESFQKRDYDFVKQYLSPKVVDFILERKLYQEKI